MFGSGGGGGGGAVGVDRIEQHVRRHQGPFLPARVMTADLRDEAIGLLDRIASGEDVAAQPGGGRSSVPAAFSGGGSSLQPPSSFPVFGGLEAEGDDYSGEPGGYSGDEYGDEGPEEGGDY